MILSLLADLGSWEIEYSALHLHIVSHRDLGRQRRHGKAMHRSVKAELLQLLRAVAERWHFMPIIVRRAHHFGWVTDPDSRALGDFMVFVAQGFWRGGTESRLPSQRSAAGVLEEDARDGLIGNSRFPSRLRSSAPEMEVLNVSKGRNFR